jgi:hypothetical protein
MFWFAVRAWMLTGVPSGLVVGLAAGLAAVVGVALELAVRPVVLSAAPTESPAATLLVYCDPNSELLAGTSTRNEAKISLSSRSSHPFKA